MCNEKKFKAVETSPIYFRSQLNETRTVYEKFVQIKIFKI